LEDGIRIDKRQLDEARNFSGQVGVLPKPAHGSSLFNAHLHQVMSGVTLGAPGDKKELADNEKRYSNFHRLRHSSLGKAKSLQSPDCREINDGALVRRALLPVIPKADEFPYLIRSVSEVLSSSGSTSMSSVCASSLSFMDAGVPISAHVSGTAVAIIKEGDEVGFLTDPRDVEYSFADMNLMVAGTRKGITAVQMDGKITGLDVKLLEEAFVQAKGARMHILETMQRVINGPREDVSPYAPRVVTFRIEPDMIRSVIGQEVTGAKIDIVDDGTVTIAGKAQAVKQAHDLIIALTTEIIAGDVYLGKVIRVVDFGAFIDVLAGRQGLLHISQVKDRVMPYLGDQVVVKVLDVDDEGRIRLSAKNIEPDRAAAARAKGTY